MRVLAHRLLSAWSLLSGIIWLGLTTLDPRLSPWLVSSSGVAVSVARFLLPRWVSSGAPKGLPVPVEIEKLGHDCAKSGRRELLMPLYTLGDVSGKRTMLSWGDTCPSCGRTWRSAAGPVEGAV